LIENLSLAHRGKGRSKKEEVKRPVFLEMPPNLPLKSSDLSYSGHVLIAFKLKET